MSVSCSRSYAADRKNGNRNDACGKKLEKTFRHKNGLEKINTNHIKLFTINRQNSKFQTIIV
jgi:hypothetical protein